MPQNRPPSGEYAPFYEAYVKLVPEKEITATLESQLVETKKLFGAIKEDQGDFRYAPGKWSLKETLGHISDSERIFAYRLLRIARGDRTPLPGFEQDDYVKSGNFSGRTLGSLVEEFAAVRHATLALLRSLDDSAWPRRGVANKYEISARALAFIVAGHELHHRKIVQERYLPALARP